MKASSDRTISEEVEPELGEPPEDEVQLREFPEDTFTESSEALQSVQTDV